MAFIEDHTTIMALLTDVLGGMLGSAQVKAKQA